MERVKRLIGTFVFRFPAVGRQTVDSALCALRSGAPAAEMVYGLHAASRAKEAVSNK